MPVKGNLKLFDTDHWQFASDSESPAEGTGIVGEGMWARPGVDVEKKNEFKF